MQLVLLEENPQIEAELAPIWWIKVSGRILIMYSAWREKPSYLLSSDQFFSLHLV